MSPLFFHLAFTNKPWNDPLLKPLTLSITSAESSLSSPWLCSGIDEGWGGGVEDVKAGWTWETAYSLPSFPKKNEAREVKDPS
jgi:hypothetical protein